MNKSSTEWVQQISTDLFLLKEKITDEEYKQILEHMMSLYESIHRSSETKRSIYIKLQDLRKKYIQLSVSFETLHRKIHESDYEEDNEVYVVM